MELHERLAALRKARGMTQESMAQALFVSRQTIYKWETGKAQPDLRKFAQICALFHVSADSLLCESPEPAEPGENEHETAEEDEDAPPSAASPLADAPPALEAACGETSRPVDAPAPKDEKPKRRKRLIWIAVALLAIFMITLRLWPSMDAEIREAGRLGIIPTTVQSGDASITERDFLQMLLEASRRRHPEGIPALLDAANSAIRQRLSREKAAYWLYCTHVWTMIDPGADMSVGKNGDVDPISLRNVYEELNDSSREQIPPGDLWDAMLCEETREAYRLFESHDGTAEMDAQVLSVVNGAYYTAVSFCAAQRSYESGRPIMELTDGRFRTKELITTEEAIRAVYRLCNAW